MKGGFCPSGDGFGLTSSTAVTLGSLLERVREGGRERERERERERGRERERETTKRGHKATLAMHDGKLTAFSRAGECDKAQERCN